MINHWFETWQIWMKLVNTSLMIVSRPINPHHEYLFFLLRTVCTTYTHFHHSFYFLYTLQQFVGKLLQEERFLRLKTNWRNRRNQITNKDRELECTVRAVTGRPRMSDLESALTHILRDHDAQSVGTFFQMSFKLREELLVLWKGSPDGSQWCASLKLENINHFSQWSKLY